MVAPPVEKAPHSGGGDDPMCVPATGIPGRARARGARLAVLALLGLATLAGPVPASGGEVYTFAVVPQFEQRKLFSIWTPILEAISGRTGVELRLVATLGVPEFEAELNAGRPDFVYTNPFHIYRERARQGYIPLLRDDVPLQGIVVVPKDSPLQDVKELAGKTLAVPSPNSFGATLLVRAELLRKHGVRVSLLNAKTHSSAYLHVATGLAVAGGGVQKTLQEQPAEVRDALRVLYRTREIPSHPVAAHPRVPAEVRQRVQRALLDLAATPAGAALLAKVPMTRPVTTRMTDFDALGALHLEEFWDAN